MEACQTTRAISTNWVLTQRREQIYFVILEEKIGLLSRKVARIVAWTWNQIVTLKMEAVISSETSKQLIVL